MIISHSAIKGTIQGQHVSILEDSGETKNFIDAQLVECRGIHRLIYMLNNVGERGCPCFTSVVFLIVG